MPAKGPSGGGGTGSGNRDPSNSAELPGGGRKLDTIYYRNKEGEILDYTTGGKKQSHVAGETKGAPFTRKDSKGHAERPGKNTSARIRQAGGAAKSANHQPAR